MPARSRAHLLLPSPQGLIHYDVVEETAFLGVAQRGGLHAAPVPFREATVVLRVEDGRYVVRALTGEKSPEVNGVHADGAPLGDGDRVRVGEHVVLFRSAIVAPVAVVAEAAPVSVAARPAPVGGDGPTRARRAPARVGPLPGVRNAARALLACGLLVMTFAIYQGVRYLQTAPPRPVTPVSEDMVRIPEPVVSRAAEAGLRAYEEAESFEQQHGGELEAAVAHYAAVARLHRGTGAAERAAARVTEIWSTLAQQVWARTKPFVEAEANRGRFRRAVAALDEFDGRFAGTDTALESDVARNAVRTSARAALDGLLQRAAPLAKADPTRAYRVLSTSGLELPLDLEVELAAAMAGVRALWDSAGFRDPDGTTLPKRDKPTVPGPDKPPPTPPAPPGGQPGSQPTPPSVPPGADAEAAARALWKSAREHLLGKRFTEARNAYDALLRGHAATKVVSDGLPRVRAGRKAADASVRGAAAFVSERAEWKAGRLTAEFEFENELSVRDDFDLEHPFGGPEETKVEIRAGMAVLTGSTALLPKVVFDPNDVAWEMDCLSDDPRDFGLIGIQEGKEYRVCAMHVGNTEFKLKKGADAKVLAGHVLWLFGDGVWRDADLGERGFVRLAVRDGNRLKSGERFRVKAELRDGKMSGEILSKNDPVELKGPMKGDDGRGVGPLRVGPFTFKGRVGVERFAVSGKVDEAWLEATIAALVATETGPE